MICLTTKINWFSIRNEHYELSTNHQEKPQQRQDSVGEMPELMLLLINFLHLIYGLLYFALLAGYVTDDERLGAYVLVLMDCTYIASPTVNFVIYCRFLKHYRKAVVDVRNFVFCIHNLRRRSSGVTTTETVWSEENFMTIKKETNVPKIGNFGNLAL